MSSAVMSRPRLPRMWFIATLEQLLPPAEDNDANEQEDCESGGQAGHLHIIRWLLGCMYIMPARRQIWQDSHLCACSASCCALNFHT